MTQQTPKETHEAPATFLYRPANLHTNVRHKMDSSRFVTSPLQEFSSTRNLSHNPRFHKRGLRDLVEAVGSRTRAIEALQLMSNMRPAIRWMVTEEEISTLEKFWHRKKCTTTLADFKIASRDEGGDYTHFGKTIPKDAVLRNQDCLYIMYIAKSLAKATEAKVAEQEMDHIKFGTSLGYPRCCARSFAQDYDEISNSPDIVWPILKRCHAGPYHWHNNILWRQMDWVLISHRPCSWSCKTTKLQAEKTAGCLKKIDPWMHEQYKRRLESWFLWTDIGTIRLEAALKINNRMLFQGILSTSPTPIDRKLLLEKQFEVTFIGQRMVPTFNGEPLERSALINFLDS